MNKPDCCLSYLYPITVERVSSEYNPFLEVVISGWKFLLNRRNANYSYGSLHILFKKVFRKLKLNWENIEDVLILGFGTGFVSETILKYNPSCTIAWYGS
jgi:spermidine synthase